MLAVKKKKITKSDTKFSCNSRVVQTNNQMAVQVTKGTQILKRLFENEQENSVS